MTIIDTDFEQLDIAQKALKEGGSEFSPQSSAGEGNFPDPKENPQAAGVDHLHKYWGSFVLNTKHAASLPAWGTKWRDAKLREALRDEASPISGVVFGEVVRLANLEWDIISDSDEDKDSEIAKWKNVLNSANFGEGFDIFVQSFATDYLSQDNGAIFEIITNKGRSQQQMPRGDDEEIVGIATIDSLQCYRTLVPEYPIVYQNPWTREWTVYHYTRVFARSQFRQQDELARGLGYCFVSRAYDAALLIKEAHIYMLEKISGGEPEIAFVSGIGQRNLENALDAARSDTDKKGATRFKGVVFIASPSIGPNFPKPEVQMVGLKSVPDGWNHQQEVELGIQKIALEAGIDSREIWTATQSGASKADAEKMDEKASAKGRVELQNTLTRLINRILPEGLTFHFIEDNSKDETVKERNKNVRATRVASYIQNKVISPEEARIELQEIGDINPNIYPEGTPDPAQKQEEFEQKQREQAEFNSELMGKQEQSQDKDKNSKPPRNVNTREDSTKLGQKSLGGATDKLKKS